MLVCTAGATCRSMEPLRHHTASSSALGSGALAGGVAASAASADKNTSIRCEYVWGEGGRTGRREEKVLEQESPAGGVAASAVSDDKNTVHQVLGCGGGGGGGNGRPGRQLPHQQFPQTIAPLSGVCGGERGEEVWADRRLRCDTCVQQCRVPPPERRVCPAVAKLYTGIWGMLPPRPPSRPDQNARSAC